MIEESPSQRSVTIPYQHLRPHRPRSFSSYNMASSHGVPRVAREGDGELEKESIREHRSLQDLIADKVRGRYQQLHYSRNTNISCVDPAERIYRRSARPHLETSQEELRILHHLEPPPSDTPIPIYKGSR